MKVRHAQASRLLGAYLDDELHADARAGVERHMAECALCARHFAGMQRLRVRLGEWVTPARAAGAACSFWLRLAQQLPARPAQTHRSPSWRDLAFPLGLAFGVGFVQAGAWLALAFSVVLALGAFSWLEPWLAGVLGNAPALSTSSLVRLTWTGWLATEAASLYGAPAAHVEQWLGTALSWAGLALFVTAASALIFLGLSGWAGLHLAGRSAENKDFGLTQLPQSEES